VLPALLSKLLSFEQMQVQTKIFFNKNYFLKKYSPYKCQVITIEASAKIKSSLKAFALPALNGDTMSEFESASRASQSFSGALKFFTQTVQRISAKQQRKHSEYIDSAPRLAPVSRMSQD